MDPSIIISSLCRGNAASHAGGAAPGARAAAVRAGQERHREHGTNRVSAMSELFMREVNQVNQSPFQGSRQRRRPRLDTGQQGEAPAGPHLGPARRREVPEGGVHGHVREGGPDAQGDLPAGRADTSRAGKPDGRRNDQEGFEGELDDATRCCP